MSDTTGLSDRQLALIRKVLASFPAVSGAILFGSRAKGCPGPQSDIDLALEGLQDPLDAARVADRLEDLPLPWRFDVLAVGAIDYPPLQDHIRRVGIRIYERPEGSIAPGTDAGHRHP